MRSIRLALLTLVLLVGACTAVPDGAASAPGAGDATAVTTKATTPRWQSPPVNGTVDYQLGGAYPPAAGVRIVTRDRTAKPAPATYGICYVNAFQTQPNEQAFWARHPTLLVRDRAGKPVQDPDWPGEYLLDISTTAKRNQLAAIVGGWFVGCARAGYRAVEPDNLDAWTRSHGRLTKAQTVAMARLLIQRAHGAGLAIAQKNTADLDGRALGFDFAVAEECQVYAECGAYTGRYGRHVIEIEYTDTPRRFFEAACRARGPAISIILRDRDVVPRGSKGYFYRAC